jgi:Glyoxalase-like domain
VSNIHHVGHVVRDIGAAISLYRRMGFVVPPPSFPALPLRPGEPAHAFGAGNTHLSFNRSFVELVTVVDVHTTGDALADATPVPLQAPAEALDQLRESIAQTAARISTALARFEGLPSLIGHSAHPNGAVQLVESVLCLPDVDLRGYERRYSTYLQRPAHINGPLRIFDLDTSEIMIVPARRLRQSCPAKSLPACQPLSPTALLYMILRVPETCLNGPNSPCGPCHRAAST